MESYIAAVLMAVTMATVFAQEDSCWKPEMEATHKFCREKVAKDKPATKDLENEVFWNCNMCKLHVFHHADDDLNFKKFDEVIETYVVEGKQQQMRDAITECKLQYDNASSKKIKAFYDCYGPKLYQEICPTK